MLYKIKNIVYIYGMGSKVGRKTKYTPECVKTICDCIAGGLSIGDSCLSAGISYQTYERWMKTVDFVDIVKTAERKLKSHLLDIIKNEAEGKNSQAGKPNWCAGAWLLERKFGDEFRLNQKIEHSGQIDGKITINIVDYSQTAKPKLPSGKSAVKPQEGGEINGICLGGISYGD